MTLAEGKCTEGCDWKRVAVRDEYGVRSTTWECRNCRQVRHRTEQAPFLGDGHNCTGD